MIEARTPMCTRRSRRSAHTRFPGARLALALTAILAAGPLVGLGSAAAQEQPNFILAPTALEDLLDDRPFQIVGMQDNRWQGDRTQRTEIRFGDSLQFRVKWARAAVGGFAINNQPRYEVAAYEFQKLFLDEADWVVPPTVMREMPLRVYRQLDPEMPPTFEGTESIVVAIQYWLQNVDVAEEPDPARVAADTAYARRLGYLSLFTHLIRHVDSNAGNVLISTEGPPRMYAVDNGVAFRSPESPRGTLWQDLWVDRLPAEAVARLRGLSRQDVEEALYVVAQFRVRDDGRLEAVEPTANMNVLRGVEFEGGVVQFGLNNLEMDELWDRIQALLERVDAGELATY